METYDLIVVGVGAMGSAALLEAARRGAKVLGLEAFEPGHDRGSSHGRTRAIRLAYFEHPDYVPLLREAFGGWRRLQQSASRELFVESGILEAGPAQGELIQGVLRAAREHDLPVERLDPAQVQRRFPGFELTAGMQALLEPEAGYLHVEDCIREMARQAVEAGAKLETGVRVEGWEPEEGGFCLRAGRQRWSAKNLILSQGAWSTALLGELGVPLTLLRKVQLWLATKDARYGRAAGSLPFAIETKDEQVFYGFPEICERGIKVAEHSGGLTFAKPLALDRELHPEDVSPVIEFTERFMPGVTSKVQAHEVCMYTQSPDGHFLVDRHPNHKRLQFVAGLSGHGFKFAPALGRGLVERALDGGSTLPLDFLSLARLRS